MKRPTPLLLLVVAGCSSERQDESRWTLQAVEGPCAPAEEAPPELIDSWGGSTTEIDRMPCTLDEVLSISAPEATAETSCCYKVRCDGELSPVQQIALFKASCIGLRCDQVAMPVFSPDAAARELARRVPQCTLEAPHEKPSERGTLLCVYTVNARYTCSTAPG